MNYISIYITHIQFSSVTQPCPTLCDPMDCSPPGPLSITSSQVYSNSCPLSWWCHPTISSSVVPFSSRLQFSTRIYIKWILWVYFQRLGKTSSQHPPNPPFSPQVWPSSTTLGFHNTLRLIQSFVNACWLLVIKTTLHQMLWMATAGSPNIRWHISLPS